MLSSLLVERPGNGTDRIGQNGTGTDGKVRQNPGSHAGSVGWSGTPARRHMSSHDGTYLGMGSPPVAQRDTVVGWTPVRRAKRACVRVRSSSGGEGGARRCAVYGHNDKGQSRSCCLYQLGTAQGAYRPRRRGGRASVRTSGILSPFPGHDARTVAACRWAFARVAAIIGSGVLSEETLLRWAKWLVLSDKLGLRWGRALASLGE